MSLSTRSTTLAFAFAATLASCADARSGVGVLVDNREGAFLQSGSEGRDPGAGTRATLDPAGAAATAAALLRAGPIAPVDAIASAQVRARTIPRLSTPEPASLLAPRGFLRPTTHQRARESNARERFRSSPDGRDASLVFVAPPEGAPVPPPPETHRKPQRTRTSRAHDSPSSSPSSPTSQAQSLLRHDPGARPGALLSLRVVGVDDGILRDVPAAAAEVSGAFPTLAFPLEDVDDVHDAVAALGCGPDVTRVDITRVCGERSGASERDAVRAVVAAAGAELTPRGVEWTSLDGRGAFVLPRGVGVDGTERRTNADLDVNLARATDATLDEIGCLVASVGVVGNRRNDDGSDGRARTLGDATLAGAGAVASAAGSGSRAHVAASRLVVAAARVAIEREMDARGGSAAAMIVVAGEGGDVDGKRRGLLAAENATGDTALAAKKFANTSTAAVVALLLFVIAACGLLAMGSMSFPSDSLLYPREKAD